MSLSEAYSKSLNRIRAAEFYFRSPIVGTCHAPSVRVAVRKFQQKVRKSKATPVRGYQPTISSLDEKTALYFSRSGGFFPYPWEPPKPSSTFGLGDSKEVKTRYITPFLKGVG
jgi:hypothetical protein